jgi:predicted nucleic acid-binding protein
VIVLETSILSLAFRRVSRAPRDPAVDHLIRLIEADESLAVPGIVLQELLSGVRSDAEVERLSLLMDGFPTLIASRSDHVRAADIRNFCLRSGIAAGTVDALIAAQTIGAGGALFTLDADFGRVARRSSLKLYAAPR